MKTKFLIPGLILLALVAFIMLQSADSSDKQVEILSPDQTESIQENGDEATEDPVVVPGNISQPTDDTDETILEQIPDPEFDERGGATPF